MSPSIQVTHPDGSTDTLPHYGHEITEDLEPSKMDQARLFTSRDALNAITVSETEDEVEVLEGSTPIFGGLLQQVIRNGTQSELVVNSYEQYSKDAMNTPAGQNYDNVNDSLIVEDAVDDVDQISKGTINTVQAATSFVFSHCSQARKIRKVEETTSGEAKYNPDKTVDYVDELGEWKGEHGRAVKLTGGDRLVGSAAPFADAFNAGTCSVFIRYRIEEDLLSGINTANPLVELAGAEHGAYYFGEANDDAESYVVPTGDGSSSFIDTRAITEGKDTSAAFTYDSGETFHYQGYYDGDPTTVDSADGLDPDATTDMIVGPQNDWARAVIDEIIVWDTKLTDSEMGEVDAGEELPRSSSVVMHHEFTQWDGHTFVGEHGHELTVDSGSPEMVEELPPTEPVGTTISPANKTLVGEPEVERRGVQDRTTHLTVLGAGEGEHQVSATLVPDDDRTPGGALYPSIENPDLNYYTYDHGDWNAEYESNPSRRIWDTYSNKDVTSENACVSLGRALIEELNTEHLEIECVVRDVEVNIGDFFHVRYPEENIDHHLRAVKVVTKHTTEGGVRYTVTFTNRADSISNPERKTVKDVERFNMAVEGTAVPINAGGARMPVDGNVDYEIQLYYPAEVVYEHRLNVRVIGLPYRAYSSGAASAGGTHDHEITLTDHYHSVSIPGHQHDVDIPNHSHPFSYGVPDHTHSVDTVLRNTEGPSAGDNFHFHEFTSYEYSGAVDTSSSSSTTTDGGGGTFTSTEDGGGTSTTTGDGGATTDTTDEESGEHTHDPEPGITAFQRYPSNCEVYVNGQEMGVSFGDGEGQFRESVDVQGALNPGQINRIRVSSDTLGHVQAYVEGDVYRQILGNG